MGEPVEKTDVDKMIEHLRVHSKKILEPDKWGGTWKFKDPSMMVEGEQKVTQFINEMANELQRSAVGISKKEFEKVIKLCESAVTNCAYGDAKKAEEERNKAYAVASKAEKAQKVSFG